MEILQNISAQELEELRRSERVALVLMGGGAKGAYELGVWKVLWKYGIRKFCLISGTSVGALNALLIASRDPDFAEKTWDDVIFSGVLEKGRKPLSGVIAIVLAHLLIFLSLIIAVILFCLAIFVLISVLYAKLLGQVVSQNVSLLFSCIGFGLVFCWFTARMDADFLGWLTTGGYALPLFSKRPKLRVKLANWVCIPGAALSIASILFIGFPSQHLPGWMSWLIPLFWALLVTLRFQGLRLLDQAVRIRPLFERNSLDATISKLTDENNIFSNCSGPVVATLARHSVYWDPYKVHPLDQRYHYDPFTEKYCLRSWEAWREAEPLGEWVPEYIDLRKAPNPAWVLSASSAIPFAFRALLRKRQDPFSSKPDVFVDGGVVDNLPLLPAVEATPDYIFVVALNAGDTFDDEAITVKKLQENWRQSFFARTENDSIADEMRKKWIESLPVNYFTEGDEFSKTLAKYARSFFAKLSPMPPGPFPPVPPFGPPLGDSKVIFIRPSTAISLDIPILNLFTGTMRFDPAYKRKLVDLGAKDTEALFNRQTK